MRRVLATAGHVDHGKSTLVRALTGRNPDRLDEEKSRQLTIELGYAWTRLPGGAEVAFVDVPGHQRFLGTMLAGLGPSPAVVFVVAADQGWQAQSGEHLAAVQALGITDGILVITRCDLADDERREQVCSEASAHLRTAGLEVPSHAVAATTGMGVEDLRVALEALVARMPVPDPKGAVRLWSDRAFSVAGAGTVVTGTLGAGTLHTGDRLELLDRGQSREVVVRGLHSQDAACDSVGPVSRVALNLRRVDAGGLSRSAVFITPGAFAIARTIDVELAPAGGDDGSWATPGPAGEQGRATPPEQATLHVGSVDAPVHVRPLDPAHARLTLSWPLPWRVGDRAVLRDPGSRRLWSLRVRDVDPLPLRRRGAAARRGADLGAGDADAEVRLRSRGADHPVLLARLGLDPPQDSSCVDGWWIEPALLARWSELVGQRVRAHHRNQPLSAGMPTAEVRRALGLPGHLRAAADGGDLPADVPALGAELIAHLADAAGLSVTDGRVHDPAAGGLGTAEAAVAEVEEKLRVAPFAAPEKDELAALRLGQAELAAAGRTGRLLRLADEVVLLPDGPARAMRELAGLEQPFTLSAARQALGTTRRVAIPLLEHLDARGWTRRVDGQRRQVVR